MRLWVSKRAQLQIEQIDQWWRENRPEAASFLAELESTFRRLQEMPEHGYPWPTRRRPELRRALLHDTQNHVYYWVDRPAQTIRVLAVWGAPRGRGPRL